MLHPSETEEGVLVTNPSWSPENQHEGKSYQSAGCTFDQQMIYEIHTITLKCAEILGIKDSSFHQILRDQLPQLKPFIIGKSGQLKEYREEEYYGDIGEWEHRHISHLLGAYPGQLINTSTPELLNAVKVSLENRRTGKTGWAEAERVATWARTRDGETAYFYYNYYISRHIMHNMWNNHRESYTVKLFQCDGNFGATAGVCEMLLQSQEYFIAPIPAIPKKWASGSYRGLLARGGFEVSADWKDGRLTRLEIFSKKGGECRIKYPGSDELTCFETIAGENYIFNL